MINFNDHLRGKYLIDLLNLPDPTKSRLERDRYINYVVPFFMFSGISLMAPLYGFNVWLIPITFRLFGDDAVYSFQSGVILYAFSSALFIASIVGLIISPSIKSGKLSTGLGMLVGSFLSSLSMVLAGFFLSIESVAGTALSILLLGVGAGFWTPLIL